MNQNALKLCRSEELPDGGGTIYTVEPSCQADTEDKLFWSEGFVLMPFSSQNLYPASKTDDTIVSRWSLIVESHRHASFESAGDIEDIIFKYNHTHFMHFNVLKSYELKYSDEFKRHLGETIPKMSDLVLHMDQYITKPIPLFQSQKISSEGEMMGPYEMYCKSITLSSRQVACLLSGAFFMSFPGRTSAHLSCKSYYHNYPNFSFESFLSASTTADMTYKIEMLRCFFNYMNIELSQRYSEHEITIARKGNFFESFETNLGRTEFAERVAALDRSFGEVAIMDNSLLDVAGDRTLQINCTRKLACENLNLGKGEIAEKVVWERPELMVTWMAFEALGTAEVVEIKGAKKFNKLTIREGTLAFKGVGEDFNEKVVLNMFDATSLKITSYGNYDDSDLRSILDKMITAATEVETIFAGVPKSMKDDYQIVFILNWIACTITKTKLVYCIKNEAKANAVGSFRDELMSKKVPMSFALFALFTAHLTKEKALDDYRTYVTEDV